MSEVVEPRLVLVPPYDMWGHFPPWLLKLCLSLPYIYPQSETSVNSSSFPMNLPPYLQSCCLNFPQLTFSCISPHYFQLEQSFNNNERWKVFFSSCSYPSEHHMGKWKFSMPIFSLTLHTHSTTWWKREWNFLSFLSLNAPSLYAKPKWERG